MSGTLNKVTIIGNLGRDPDVRLSADGRKRVNLAIATSENWKDKSGQRQERTDWHNVVIFSDGLADVAEKYLRKGSKCYVEGGLQTRKWQDKSGADKYTTEIVVGNRNGVLKLLDPAPGSNGEQRTSGKTGYQSPLDDEIPY